ncbi:transcription initiation factor TFIID subunit 11-like isoform X2 [Homarus americanus]|uniref:Uncharacterized protein n=1 Tax=Homarus americanus TaxID=6706 RepID=A0A8J5KM12_HOMAM|nr:transcription initiation factor TFIID subunit 11-like isoform X2 [Homarus americanus]KAG7170229.1 hypothetical protein Hamer_G026327 [Homarus americanus]
MLPMKRRRTQQLPNTKRTAADQYSDDQDGDLESEESDEERESELPTKSILSSRKGKASKLGGKTGNTDLAKGKKTQPSTQSLGKSDKLINKLVKSKPAVVSHLGNTETVSKSRSTGNELRKATNKESHDSEDDYESDNLDQENDNDDSDQENDNDESDQENDNDDWDEENYSDGSDEESGSKETNKNRIANTPIQQNDDESSSSSSSEKAMVRPAWLIPNRGQTVQKREDTSEESESESD